MLNENQRELKAVNEEEIHRLFNTELGNDFEIIRNALNIGALVRYLNALEGRVAELESMAHYVWQGAAEE